MLLSDKISLFTAIVYIINDFCGFVKHCCRLFVYK